MEIRNKRVKITLSREDIELIEKMRRFTDEYHTQNNNCEKLSCVTCPLNIFCIQTNETTLNAFVTEIERHLNNEL